MEKLVSLKAAHMKLDNLAGLCDETITAATPYIAALVAVLRRRRRPKDGGGQGNE